MNRNLNTVISKTVIAAATAAILILGLLFLDRYTGIPPYWLNPHVLAWLFVGALYILSAIYLALDELAGVEVPTPQWLTLLVFGGIVLMGINRAHLFSSDVLLLIAEYSLIIAALIIWSLAVSLIISANGVPPLHRRLLVQVRRIRNSLR